MINHLITNAVLNISSDVMIMLIPLPLVFKVKISLEKKIVLGCIFFIGIFTVCISILDPIFLCPLLPFGIKLWATQ